MDWAAKTDVPAIERRRAVVPRMEIAGRFLM
jgi:hypothetical protein